MPRLLETEQLGSLCQPGERVYLPGSSGAPQAFLQALQQSPAHSRGLALTSSLVPGINSLDIDSLASDARLSVLFMQPAWQAAQQRGQVRALPGSYAGFVRQLRDGPTFDLCVVQLAPPDALGRCSLGPLAEFTPTVLRRSRRVLGIINPQVPVIAGAPWLDYDALDLACADDTPLPTYSVRNDDASTRIAAHLACLIEDGSTVQMGLGAVPNALYQALGNHRGLRLHSGMFSDGLIDLAQTGALDADFAPTTCALVGSNSFYAACADLPGLRVRGCEFTHHPLTLSALERFVAVNSALEVDLLGQCNLEHANGRAVSGMGGAPDFARAARLSVGGCSIVALNATFGRSEHSRIVPCLSEGSTTSLARSDIDCVVTEFGIADLRGCSVHERAHALIGIAAPQHRDALAQAWEAIAARL